MPTGNNLFWLYVIAFGLASILSFLSVPRALNIEDTDTRHGLVALLLASGAWAGAHVGFLLAPSTGFKLAFYHVGLLVGFAAVGPWLYFCSAYSGRTLHRSPTIRRMAIALFLAVAAVKITNHWHELYFSWEVVTDPFAHVAIQSLTFHWVVMGLSYALAFIGYFLLLELFWQVGHDTKPLAALVLITGLPVALDIAGAASPLLINITYEPLGVAAFSVGLLWVFIEDFQTVQLAGEHGDPIIVLGDENQIRDFNTEAEELFPDLEIGKTLGAVVPEVAANIESDDLVVQVERIGGMRYYQLSVHPFSADSHNLRQAISFKDVTEREQYRTQLESQNERLDQFATMVSHDLRNPLNVASMRIDLAQSEFESDHLAAAMTATERMEAIIEDLLTLARQGELIDEMAVVSLDSIVNNCWDVIATESATISVDGDLEFLADPERLQQLLENLFRNAIEHGSDDVSIQVGPLPEGDGFYVADDGPGIPEDDRAEIFDFGFSTNEEGTGYGLGIVQEIVSAHEWEITIEDAADGGARFEISGVSTDTDAVDGQQPEAE